MRWLAAAAWVAACSAPEATPPDLAVPDLSSNAVCSDGADAAAASFENAQRIFDNRCIGCHCCDAYLNLTRGGSYAMLVGRPTSPNDQMTDESCGGVLVVPGDAGVSYLYQKLSNPQPCAGAQMPRSEIGSSPLPNCEQDVIKRWIAEGAQP